MADDRSRNDLESVANGDSGVPRHALSIQEKRDAAPLPRRRRHKKRNCCICCGITSVLVVIVIVILVFTVFKEKQPEIHVNSISLNNFSARFNGFNIPSVNVTLGVDVTIKNPNHAGFKYTNSTAYMYYHGEQVGESPIPAGEIGAQGTEDVITSVTLLASNLLTNSFLLSDFLSGVLPFSVSTDISGRVNILHIFKHHVDVSSVCAVSISISSASIQKTDCDNQVKL